jgi:hypothetical protein
MSPPGRAPGVASQGAGFERFKLRNGFEFWDGKVVVDGSPTVTAQYAPVINGPDGTSLAIPGGAGVSVTGTQGSPTKIDCGSRWVASLGWNAWIAWIAWAASVGTERSARIIVMVRPVDSVTDNRQPASLS